MKLKLIQLKIFNIYIIIIFNLLLTNIGYNQNKELLPYIPYKNTSLLSYPKITIKTKIHIIYRYENDAQNYTLDSINLIKDQIKWINGFYKHLSKSTLKTKDGKEHFIPDSRIRFRLDTIDYFIDSTDWNRIYMTIDKRPIKIDSINLKQNKIYIQNRFFGRLRRQDSIIINNKVFKITNRERLNNYSYLTLNAMPKSNIKEFSYFRKQDLNCDRYLWEKYTNSDTANLHIFFTGSSIKNVAFGCGPSPYFLNMSNLIKGGGWANAQLLAHEIGHTLGLYHTNSPQFDDLPTKDKFSFSPCDSIKISNNIMGYNQCRNYLSPKQVGYIHYLYSTRPNRIGITTANEYNSNNTFVIFEDTIWNKAMVITGDIVVKKRKTLTINSSVHLSTNSTIYLEKKSKLILNNNSMLYNCFGTNWKGINKCRSIFKPNKKVLNPKKRAKIIISEGSIIKNTQILQ